MVRHLDTIQLLHVNSQSYLLTHDVASPTMPTNQEFTTWPKDDHTRHNETLFTLELNSGRGGQAWKSKSGHFHLVHVDTKVALWTHSEILPDWAFKQQEINGHKDSKEKTATWFVDEIIKDESELQPKLLHCITYIISAAEEELEPPKPFQPKKMSFFKKYAELQLLMFQHNAGLTSSHPYASTPINWPFLLTGISFWTENDPQKQIYMIGNLIGWWTCVVALSIYVGIICADLLARRRGIDPIPDRKSCTFRMFLAYLKLSPQPCETVYGTQLGSSCWSGQCTIFPSSSCLVNFSFIITFHHMLPPLW